MKKISKLGLIVGLIAAIFAIVTTISFIFVLNDKKKKDEEDLEHYLHYSIQ